MPIPAPKSTNTYLEVVQYADILAAAHASEITLFVVCILIILFHFCKLPLIEVTPRGGLKSLFSCCDLNFSGRRRFKVKVFRDVTPCSVVVGYLDFLPEDGGS
jgi:hypothetical protein